MTDSWNKYNKHKAIGGIVKKARGKAQKEMAEVFKVDDDHNFETIANAVKMIDEKVTDIQERIGVIEARLEIEDSITD